MKVVVLGCGRVGSRLSQVLDRQGHDVTVIDRNAEQFRRLGSEFRGRTIRGTGIDGDVLRSAGIESADLFVAVTNGDNTSIMASQMAKELFNVPRVVTRIYDPVREDLYSQLGLDTVCPTTTMTELILGKVLPDGQSHQADGER